MKNILSNLLKKFKGFITCLTPSEKIRYIVISVLTVAVAASLLSIVILNTEEPETNNIPSSNTGGETVTIDFDTEIIFGIDDETSGAENELNDDSDNDTTQDTNDASADNTQDSTDDPSDNEDTEDNDDPAPADPSNSGSDVDNTPGNTPSNNTQGTTKPSVTTQSTTKPSVTTQTATKPTETTKPIQTTTKPAETTKPVQTTSKPAEIPAGFVVKEKKYDYNGANVSILNVENKSQKAYTITITGKFKDASGNVLKTESKTFKGFPAGWSNYFLFQPGVKYSSVSWDMKTVEFTERTYAQGISPDGYTECSITQMYGDSNGKVHYYPETPDCRLETCVVATFCSKLSYDGNATLGIKNQYVAIDGNGDIMSISNGRYIGNIDPTNGEIDQGESIPLFATGYLWNERDKYVMPEYLKNVTVIRSVISVAEE